MAAEHGATITGAVRALARPEALPAIVHCTGGKDRTGVVVTPVLAALGVPDEVIAADFSATGLFLDGEFRQSLLSRNAMLGVDSGYLAVLLTAEPELVQVLLDSVREAHGDVPTYLLRHGFETSELETLRNGLLQPEDPTGDAR